MSADGSIVTSDDVYHGDFHWRSYASGGTQYPTGFIHFDDAALSGPVTLPAEPTNFRVSATSATSATLNWTDASNNENNFVTKYKVGNGDWTAGPVVGAGVTSATISGLSPSTRYTFQVGARNPAGTHFSAYAYGTTGSGGPAFPAEPTNVRVTATSGSSATLNWTDASNNEDSFVTQYKSGSGGFVAGPTVGAGVTSVTITGLSVSTAYTFQVGAHNAAGTHFSAYATGTTGSGGPALPAEPTNVRVSATSATSATLNWTDASNNENNFVTKYKVGNGDWTAGPVVGAGVTSATISGLSPSTTYTFQVGARNPAGTHFSAYATGTTGSGGPAFPAEPTNVRVSATSASSATLTWTDASNNEDSFVTQYKSGSGGFVAGPTVGAGVTSVTITGLSASTAYTFQVGAHNAAGTHFSAYATGTTGSGPAFPAEPTNVRVSATSGSSATLTWTDASNNEDSFVTQYKSGSGGFVAGPTVGAGVTSVTISGLSASTAYTFQVGAHNAAGTHFSAYATGTTTAAPTSQLNYQVTNYDSDGTSGVYLRNSSDVNDVNRDSAHFVSYGTTVTLLCGASGSAVGPQSNTAWDSVRVSDGRTGWLSEHWLNTPVGPNQHVAGEPTCSTAPPAFPAEPTNVRVSATSGSSATLTWTDASNNEDSFVTQYKSGSGGFVAGPTVGAGVTSVTITGLSASTAYTFQVGAHNAAGTHFSAYATGTTTAAPTSQLNYQVTNYDSDGTSGVYLRNSSNINDVNRDSAHFVSYGTTVTLLCGGFGSAVGPSNNTAWDYVRVSDGRQGWISEHWLNTPVGPNQHVSGEPNC